MWSTVIGIFIGIGIVLGLPRYLRWEREHNSKVLFERDLCRLRHPAGKSPDYEQRAWERNYR